MRRLALLALAACALAVTGTACSSPDDGARVDATALPSGAAFRPVAIAVLARCGSLDCHGSKYRNLRLYGYGGLRLDPNARPETKAGGLLTEAEVDADYQAVVGVEPELTRQVAAEGGRGSERLTFVRKARGEEAHKGGARIAKGDAADVCVQSWLARSVDVAACTTVAAELEPPAAP